MSEKKPDIKYLFLYLYNVLKFIDKAGRWLAILNWALLLLQAALPVTSLYFIKLLVELIVAPSKIEFNTIIPVIIGFGIIQFLIAVANQVSLYINTLQQQNLSEYLSERVLTKAVEIEYSYYENPDYHDNLHLAQQQAQYKSSQILANFDSFVLNSLSLLFLTGLFLTLQSSFALIFILLSIPLAIIKWYYGYQLQRLEAKFIPLERQAGYFHHVLTAVSYAKEVRVFGLGMSFIKKFHDIRTRINSEKKRVHFKLTLYSILAHSIEVIVMVVLFLILAKNAWMGLITAGVFVIYLQGFQKIQTTSRNFLQSLTQILQLHFFLKNLLTFFDMDTKGHFSNHLAFPKEVRSLHIQNISFTYPGTQKEVLKDVNLKCGKGQILAIVGANGSGKSTLLKLIGGLYAVQSGSICIDEINFKDIIKEELRLKTVILFQDFEKYFLTVKENIEFYDAENADKVMQAAHQAGAINFIEKLPDGFQTKLGRTFEKSEQLSGGQWQKLAWARVFYKDAKLVLLDEPTSSIDAIAEKELYDNLRKFATDKIVILISHTLYNLKLADSICVMNDGKIAEQGSFEELINKAGLFKQMYQNQRL